MTRVKWILRIGISFTFLGHGIFAYNLKTSWLPYLTVIGFSTETAITIMPLIGVLDIIVATLVLIYPTRILLIWATIWAFATALIRPVSGMPIWDFIERGANWAAPLALLFIVGFPKNVRDLFSLIKANNDN